MEELMCRDKLYRGLHTPGITIPLPKVPLDKTTVERQLAQGHDPNIFDEFGNGYLQRAILANQTDVVEILLKHGADPNLKDVQDFLPLHLYLGNYTKDIEITIVKRFLEYGADPNMLNYFGSSALHWAVYERNTDSVKILLEHGANPNLSNKKNDTPLSYCAYLWYQNKACKGHGLIDLMIQYSIMWTISNISSDLCKETYCMHDIKRIIPAFLADNEHYRSLVGIAFHCIYEIKKMRRDFIRNQYTLFNFVSKHCSRITLVDHDSALLVIDEVILRLKDDKYPHCKDIIFASIKHSLLVDRLCELTVFYRVPAASSNTAIFTLDAHCIDNLAKYLSKDDILNMIFAFCDKFGEHECFLKNNKAVASLKRSGSENEEFICKKPRKSHFLLNRTRIKKHMYQVHFNY